jgi:histidinol-phosphate/aromatic aminotransferase/cobyric acid decarboxylase-like protein
MTYQAYRLWRDRLMQTRTPRRLDCMNPQMALAHLRPRPASEPPARAATVADALAAWRHAGAVRLPAEDFLVGTGVRPILEALFAQLAGQIDTLWLPGDVYPVYWELSAHVERRGFWTLPTIDWSFLAAAGPRDALLIPHPLAPLGRPLTSEELARLRRWVEARPGRRIILDAAYQLTAPFDEGTRRLGSDAQVIAIWSLSKPWLARDLLGIARVSSTVRAELQPRLRIAEPAALARAIELMTTAPELPARLERRFAVEWSRLADELRPICPEWQPPASGYFAVLPRSAERLLAEHDVLAIPASVFGAAQPDLSVVTCLHDLETRDRDAARPPSTV